jgi:hypothetical protein
VHGSGSSSPSASSAVVLKPVSAHGFDALNLADTGDENDNQAANVLNDTNGAGARRTTSPPSSAT